MIEKNDDISNLASLDLQLDSMWEMWEETSPSIKFRIQSTTLPFDSIKMSTREPIGTKHYENYTPIEEFTITFLETTDFSTFNYLNTWFNSIFDKLTMTFSIGNKWKNFVIAFQHDVAVPTFIPSILGQGGAIGSRMYNIQFRLENCLIKQVDQGLTLTYESGQPLKFSATFSADRIIPFQSIAPITL